MGVRDQLQLVSADGRGQRQVVVMVCSDHVRMNDGGTVVGRRRLVPARRRGRVSLRHSQIPLTDREDFTDRQLRHVRQSPFVFADTILVSVKLPLSARTAILVMRTLWSWRPSILDTSKIQQTCHANRLDMTGEERRPVLILRLYFYYY